MKTVGKHSLLGLALAATENERLRDNPEQTELLVFYTAFYDAIGFIEYPWQLKKKMLRTQIRPAVIM